MSQESKTLDFIGYVQRASISRANRWHGGDFRQWSGLEWAGAMCGEAGEAANVAKKLRRVELAIDGNAASERKLVPSELVEKLASECADVFLYLVLLAARYDIDLTAAIVATFNKKSDEMGFPEHVTTSAAARSAAPSVPDGRGVTRHEVQDAKQVYDAFKWGTPDEDGRTDESEDYSPHSAALRIVLENFLVSRAASSVTPEGDAK